MATPDKQYYVQLPGFESGETWDAAKFERNKDSLYNDHSDAKVYGVTGFGANDDVKDGDLFDIKLPGYDAGETWDYKKFNRNREKLMADHPDVQIQRKRPITNWNPAMAAGSLNDIFERIGKVDEELAGIPNEEASAADLRQMDDEELVKAAAASQSPSARRRRELKKERERLLAEQDKNPVWREYWEKTISNIDDSVSHVDEMRSNLDKANPKSRSINKFSGITDRSGLSEMDLRRDIQENPEYYRDQEALAAAKMFYSDARKIAAAPSKYGEESGLSNYWKGVTDNAADALSVVALAKAMGNLPLIDAVKKIQEHEGKDVSITNVFNDPSVDLSYLSDAQKELVNAFVTRAKTESWRSDNLSRGYQAGKGAIQSAGFMADFLLMGGAGDAVADKVAGKLVEKTAENSLARIGAESLYGLVKGTVMTPLMPSSYANVLNQIAQLDDQGRMDLSAKAIRKAGEDAWVEAVSEMIGAKPLEVLGWGLGKALPTDWITKTKFGAVGKVLRDNMVFKTMKQAGYNGFFEEMFEEVSGNAARVAMNLDKDALKNFFSKDELLITAASFAPMSVLGGIGSVARYGYVKNKYNSSLDDLKIELKRLKFSDEQINHITDLGRMSTPEEVKKSLEPVVEAMAERGATEKDIKGLLNYAYYASSMNVYKAYESEKVREGRDSVKGKLSSAYGDFWQGDEKTGQTVQRVTLPDGRTGYAINSDEDGETLVNLDGGGIAFIHEGDGSTVTTQGLDQYLDGIILAREQKEDEEEMQAEAQAAQQQFADNLANNAPVPMGTVENPVVGQLAMVDTQSGQKVPARDDQGNYIVNTPDGQVTVSEQDLASKWGIVLTPKTKAQKEADATAEYSAAKQRQETYNRIPRGTTVEATLEGEESPVEFKFTHAVYDEEEGTMKIYVEDENGEEDWYPESAFPGLKQVADAQVQAGEQKDEVIEAADNELGLDGSPVVRRDATGKELPLNEDGSVNEAELWDKDPESWAAWNDSQRQDGGANSVSYVQAAANQLMAKIDATQKAYATELDFNKRNAMEQEIAENGMRLEKLNSILDGYKAREEAAKNAVEEAAVQQEAAAEAEQEITPEQAEAERQAPLRERIAEWVRRTGQQLEVYSAFDEIPEDQAMARVKLRLGERVAGWFNPTTGNVVIYLPNVSNEAEIDKTYMHEVISHKGLREMLGVPGFNELADHTWNDIMSEEDRQRYLNYVSYLRAAGASEEDLRRAAADEYIAHLAENIDENPTAWEKFVAKVKEILEKVLGMDLKITDDDLKILLQASLARYEELAKEGNQEARARLTDSGIASNVEEVRFSVKYAPKSEEEAGRIVSDIVTQTGVSEEEAKRWVESETSLADIIGTKENQPYLDYTGDDRYDAIKENSDYPQGTVDFNNICRKRLAFTDMYQRIQKAFPNVIITGEDLANIRNIMKSHGLTVACGLCYVEDRRQLLGEIAKDFIDNYNGNFEEYASRGGEAKKKNADKFRKLIGEDRKDDLSIYDLITLSGSAKLYEEHPGIYNAFQAFNNARGQQSGNLFQGYAEYKREILKWSKKKVENVNNNGGLRVFSYSDFEAHHLIDLVQIIQDCARKGVKIQGYTKVPAFARAVANTGIKLNRSLIPLGDTGIVDGRLAYDPVEGIDVNDPNFLESNDNVGNILIGINDQQIRLAMADPFVHYIIPYHSNQREVLRSLKQTGAWTNYKPYQNEKDASGKTTLINIYTEVLAAAEAEGDPIKTERQFTEKFLAVCKEKGLTPRFEQFLDRVGGEYVYTPGYYKLLLDFKMFDEQGNYLPQNPVVAQFDDAFNAEILNDYVKGEKEKFDGNLDEVYNEIVMALGLEGREQDVQPKTGDQILGEILESIDRKNAKPSEEQAGNESDQMLFRKGDPSTEVGNTFFRINDGTLVGLHNISEEKLRKADKAGGLANPSAAVIDITRQEHKNFGEISLVMPSAMVSATSGKNGGTYLGDAWTPTFPGTQKKMSKAGAKAFDKQIMALPADVRYNVENAFENYLEEDRDGNALRWWFLNETGRNPSVIHHESPYSKEDEKVIENLNEWELKDEDLRTLGDLYRKYASEEDVRKATTKFEPREEAKESVRKWMREYNEEIDKYGINVTSVERFLRQAKDQIRQDGRLDDYRTMDSARQFIEDNNLGEEFRSWLEGKEEEFGVETKLFAGWDRNGYKKWLDYTAENASKLMNKESGRNAYSDNGLSATHALLVRKMRTLAEIRKNKDLLVTRAEYDERYDQVDKELHSAISVLDGMQKISDNPFTNYDYTASRLQEALTHTNPVAYLNSAYKYTIPEDGEYAQQLEKLRKDIMEMPVNYFETKFNRPVGLSEFTSAVVPSNLDEKTRKILEDAGVTMFEYDPNQEGSRRDATMRATEQEGIRFRVANENQRIFVSNAEKAVEEMKMDKATPEQWKKTLEKNGGLKAAEDKWLGLSTWLDGLDRKTVTKQEVLDFIAENQIKIEEVHYAEEVEREDEAALKSYQQEYLQLVDEGEEAGEENAFQYGIEQMLERYGDDFGLAFTLSGHSLEPNTDWNGELSDAARYFLDQRRGGTTERINSTRLGYTTEGLTNRQEIALTVPTIEPWNEGDKIHFGDAGEGRAISWARFGDTWTSKAKDDAEKKYRDADKAFRDYRNEIVAKYALQATDSKKTIDLATEEETAKVKALRDEANRLYHEWQYGQHPREKVLVIDEIQSKRHQEAREQGGYKDDSALKVAAKRQRDTYDAYNEFHRRITDKYGEDARSKMTPEEDAEYQRLYREFRDAENAVSRNGFDPMADEEYRRLLEEQRAHENSPEFKGLMEDWMNAEGFDARQTINEKLKPFQERNRELLNAMEERERILADEFNATHKSQIPAAPFEKNWPELTMKRMLRYAAENGYDTVAWTTGDQQAERYSLSKVVERVNVEPFRDGSRDVTIHLSSFDGEHMNMLVNEDGVVTSGEYNGQKLSAIVGTDLATKIMGAESREEFEGEDLKVGGEGMKGFYDDILPRFMNKYGKKWGVKVEDIYLPALGEDAAAGAQKGLTMHSVPVTDEMKESVMQGQTMFRVAMEEMDKESKELFDAAKERFGTTKDLREAGYILPDGTMLDFSGRHMLDPSSDSSFLKGRRTTDHREVESLAFEKDGNTPTGIETDMYDFIRRGAIRIDANSGAINLAVKPTAEQATVIERVVRANDGDVWIDFGENSDHYVEYEGAKPVRVLNDIRRYFDEGYRPGGNIMFRKAPNGKESNLNDNQYDQVRTPQFKNWFGDWLTAYRVMNPVVVKSNTEASERVKSILNKPLHNERLGMDAILTGNDLDKMNSDKATKKSKDTRLHAMAIANVQMLFETAGIDVTQPDSKGRKSVKIVHRLGSTFYDAERGEFVPVKLTVIEFNKDGNHIYTIEAVDIENEKSAGQLVARAEATEQTPSADFITKIQDYLEETRTLVENVSKVVDENGEPRVVEHATNADFSEFDISHLGENSHDKGLFGAGFYFGTRAPGWMGGSKNLMRVYLNIRKPFETSDGGSELGDIYDHIVNKFNTPALRELTLTQYGKSIKMGEYIDIVKAVNDEIAQGLHNEAISKDEDLQSYAPKDRTGVYRDRLISSRAGDFGVLPHSMGYVIGEAIGSENFTDALRKDGYDGVIVNRGADYKEYVVFEPNQVKSATDNSGEYNPRNNDIRFRKSNENQKIFISNAEASLDRIKMEKATPEQWIKMLEKEGGLKAAEDKWLGLSQWLGEVERKTVSKQEIADFIAKNQIQIEEQRYSENVDLMREATEDVRNTIGRGKELEELQAEVDELVASEEYQNLPDDEAKDEWLLDQMKERYGDDFEKGYFIDEMQKIDYALEPWDIDEEEINSRIPVRKANSTRLAYTTEGLTNRQEIALTIPTIEPWNESDKIHFGDAGEGRAVAWARFGDTTIPEDGGEKRRAFEEIMSENDRWYQGHPQFAKYGIGDESLERESEERKARQREAFAAAEAVPKKKVLVIDEIQSKRHQEGREKGYTPKGQFDDATVGEFDVKPLERGRAIGFKAKQAPVFSKDGKEIGTMVDNDGWFYIIYPDGSETSSLPTPEKILEIARLTRDRNIIPPAPFEKNWPELTMKRMLRYAAENGYDTVAWTTGEQQAKRYSLSSVIDRIEVVQHHDGTGVRDVYLDKPGGREIELHVNKDGEVVSVGNRQDNEFVGKSLGDIIGKELAVKAMTVKTDRIGNSETIAEGGDLRVGGEGMKGFYDDILVRWMNKYGKKWGVKVEDIYLPALGEDAAAGAQKGLTMHSVPVTDEMKESVMQGQTMFRKIEDRQEKESAKDFVSRAVKEIKKDYKPIANIVETPTREKDTTGGYNRENKTIAIFVHDDTSSYKRVENTFFHENFHAYVDKFKVDPSVLGQFVADSKALLRQQALDAIDKHVRDRYADDEYNDEMSATIFAEMAQSGKSDTFIDNASEEVGDLLKDIYNKLGYDTRKERLARGPEGSGELVQRGDASARTGVQMRDSEAEGAIGEGAEGVTLFRNAGEPAPTADQLVKRVQDYGLRGILDEDAAKAFWTDAYAVMPEDARRQIVDQAFSSDSDRQELNIRRYTRQYIADLAKKGYAEDESGLLRYLADKIKAELGQYLDENTLRYLIWRSANRYASNNILDLAEDISMRRRLHVGEFTGEKYPDEVNEAMNAASERIDEAETDREEARATTRRAARKSPYEALNRAMSAQRKYDQETVNSIVALAKDMIKKGNVDSVTAREMARLMTIIKDANGRRPATVKASANQLLDFLVDHTISKEKGLLDKIVKVRTAKVREPGVDTIAKLDLRAQNVINAFRENYKLSEEEIDNAISELEDKMADGRRTDASLEDMRSQLEGLQLAKQYAADISAKEADIKAIRQQMKDAQDEFAGLTAEEKKKFRTSLNEELATGEEMIRAKKIEEVEAYRRLRGDIAGAIDEGAERAKTFLEAERERVEQIHHWANSDMQGVPTDVRDRKITGWAKVANWPAIRLVTAPLANLDQMLRTLGRKSPEGRGYLWNWMMGAVRRASDNEKLGLDAAEKKLNDKVRYIFDDPKMEWNDLYALERKMPKSKMRYFSANGEWVEEDLTQGNLLYIYMVNKMADGRMKLRQMNISEDDVQEIKKALDPRLVELADWIQEEFLPGLRDRYNGTHKRLFGTSMASIENYFPLRILGGVVEEKRNVGDQEGKALPSDITGAIIKRTVNSKQLNLATDALSTVIEHVKEMEQWNAYAEASRDFSTLLKYKRFQNQLKQLNTIYGAGQDLMNLFWDTVNLSVGAYRPTTTPADKAFLNIAKGVTAAKISFRAYTALKQMLSWPAFLADTNTFILAKNTLPSSWKKNWEWAMENLPNFKKRVESRKAGMDILEDTKLDSKFWGTDFAKWINQNGMFMNAFVDALTVSIGAKSVFDTKKARYLEEGFSEEEADKKAKFDAEVAYNETQQSSEKEFMSTMQANRTVLNVALSAYRNSSMGYQRQLHQALRTLGRMSRKGYKQESIEYMTKQLTREGLSEADAEKAAKARYARAGYQAAIRVAVFGWLVQFAWNLGSHAVYLLFGDDPDEKKAMLKEDAGHALVGGGIEGLAAGNVMSDLLNMIRNKENLRNWDPTTLPIMSDIKSTISHMSSDPVAAWNDLVYLGAQIGLGTNPQTLSDAIVAIVDAANGDFETAREVMLCIMRILAVPQSQLDQIMIDEIGMKAKDARELTYEDVAKRYVDYKMMRNAPVTGEVLGRYESESNDGLRAKREKSLKTTFKKKYDERKNLKGEE